MAIKKELGILIAIGAIAAVIFGPLWWRPASPCLLGDTVARAQARIPEALKGIYFDAQKMQFGLGAGAIGGWEGLGDALVTGGTAWVRTTNVRSPKYYSVVGNRYFQSNAFVYVAPGRNSNSRFPVTPAMPLAALWEALAKKHPDGVMFAGYVRLAPLKLIAIARPATDGRPVSKNAPYYYTRPMESATEAWAYVVGIAASTTAMTRPGQMWLSALLPAGSSRTAAGLAHALRLNAAPENLEMPPAPERVVSVGQLAADTTMIEGELRLYPVTRAGHCDAVAGGG